MPPRVRRVGDPAVIRGPRIPRATRLGRLLRGAALVSVLALVLAAGLWMHLQRRHPFPLEALDLAVSGHVTLAADGREVLRHVAGDEQWRRPVPLAEMGRWLPLATIAVEDARFRRHRGVDPRAVLRAAWRNLRAGRVREGASTLTMQLVDLTLHPPRTLRGKVWEAWRAVQLELLLGKDEILERYLNLAPYGGNVTGASMGALAWFGRPPGELCLEEAALLAGLPQGPSRLRPDRHPERARLRRRAVLDAMLRGGAITREQHVRADGAPLPTRMWPAGSVDGGSSTFHAASAALGRAPAGARLALRPHLQDHAWRVVQRHRRHFPPDTDMAVLAVDVASGEIVVHVGSADPADPIDGQVDGTRAWRSPGSALKPFVYAAALELGLVHERSLLEDTPLDLAGWAPENFDPGFEGPVPLDEALRRSLNLPALRLARQVGLARCVGVMEAAGVRLPGDAAARSGLALVTGGTRVRLVDLVNAYATLARGGLHRPVHAAPNRDPAADPLTRVLSQETCATLERILGSDARAPLLRSGASHCEGVRFMWKTGTSSGHRDAWAVGHDRELAIGVWVGRFSGEGHPSFTGARAAEPILADLMAR